MAIFLSEGEEIIRTYNCARVDLTTSDNLLKALGIAKRDAATDCTVTVTNKRIIYFAESDSPAVSTDMPSMHSQEAFVDRVTSLEFIQGDARNQSAFPFGMFVAGLVITVMALMADKLIYLVPGITLLALGLAIFVPTIKTVKPLTLMRICTTSTGDGIRVSGLSPREEEAMAFYMVPNKDFIKMSSEMGALILDLQSKGDDGIENWKVE